MELIDYLKRARSVSKFKEGTLAREDIISLIDVGRFAFSLNNQQCLRYKVSLDADKINHILKSSHLGIDLEKSQPSSLIAITAPKGVGGQVYMDLGASFQNMSLFAFSKSWGMYLIQHFSEKEIVSSFNIPEEQQVLALIALGQAESFAIAENIDLAQSTKAYLNNEGHLRAPKITSKYLISWC